MSLALFGLGTASPPNTILQSDAAALAADRCGASQSRRVLPVLYRRTGVQTRASVLLDETADPASGTGAKQSFFPASRGDDDSGPSTSTRMKRYQVEAGPLALQAARQALTQSERSASSITHLVTVSCSGFAAPGVDLDLIEGLNLPLTVVRTHVGFMGCHGAINALRVAQAFAEADSKAMVLICAVELCTLHFQYGDDPQQMVANSLFADGAAAVVCAAPSDKAAAVWTVQATASSIFPNSRDAMSWTIGDNGFLMTLSRRVPDLIEAGLRSWLCGWLEGQELSLADVGSWAVHPGGPRILTSVETALELSETALEPSRSVLAAHGNMSSPTILFLLKRLAEQNACRPCVALGFGPGLVAEAAILR